MPALPGILCLLSLSAVLLTAQDASPGSSRANPSSWKNKPMRQWEAEDARQLLLDSPWVKYVTPNEVRDLSASERRDSGDWDADIGKGVGIAGTGILGPMREAEAIRRAHEKPPVPPVMVRWESALPVRAAEQKAGETAVPSLDTDDYAVVIYDIPVPNQWNISNELKGIAAIRRDHKKDLKPSRVKILRQEDGKATVVYLFPRSVEITKKDGRLEFVAQIRRLVVSSNFFTQDMQLQGELQLLMPAN